MSCSYLQQGYAARLHVVFANVVLRAPLGQAESLEREPHGARKLDAAKLATVNNGVEEPV